MSYIRRTWHYIFTEPFTWLFYSFFQPARFKREHETKGLVKRMVSMLRLALPMFLCTYPLALLLHLLWAILPSSVASFVLLKPITINAVTLPAITQFLLALAVTISIRLLWSLLWGIAAGIRGGIAWGLILCIAGGSSGSYSVVSSSLRTFQASMISQLERGTIYGIAGGIVGIIARFIIVRRGIGKDIVGGAASGAVGGIVGELVAYLIASNISGIMNGKMPATTLYDLLSVIYIAGAFAGSIAGSIARPIAEKRGSPITIVAVTVGGITGCIGGIVCGLPYFSWSAWEWVSVVAVGIGVGSISGVIGAVAPDIVEANDNRKNISTVLMILVASVLYFGIVISVSIISTISIVVACVMGLILGMVRPSTLSLVLAIQFGIGRFGNPQLPIKDSVIVNLMLFISYIIGYYRLPLYLFSSLSTIRAYLGSREYPSQVFTYLHRSALYWDERAFLPLPGLKGMLVLAARQNIERTSEEIAFIIAERHEQIGAAWAASLEIAIRSLEECQELYEIAQASQRLTEILPQEAELIDRQWIAPFARLHDASRDAARACSPLGWQQRRIALQEMIVNLKKVHPNTAFKDAQLNIRLAEIVTMWQKAAQQGLEMLALAPERTSRIDNPYNPGQILELHDSRFVGRHDLAQHLGEALGRGRSSPTFLLYGERRMGKSSTLKQLPDLLGAHYLPIFCDLQIRGFSASTAIFLGKIADEIAKAMSTRGLPVRKLSYQQLQEASKRSETEVYYQFERWFELLEPILEEADRTILLTFDEFEKLEDAGDRKDIDLELLLDWFRSVIQHHPRLALLFSGVHTFGEMGEHWAGYFVNVQTLKVSFLQPAEARQLITQPVSDFPGQHIFGERVVDAIMQVTNCHPFLIQALCSALIDDLNVNKRTRIELPDVVSAADQVLKNWGDTYFRDLWGRTDKIQRACIIALSRIGEGDLLTIQQQTGLDRTSIRTALDSLIQRDLVVYHQGDYRILVHLFRYWIERKRSS